MKFWLGVTDNNWFEFLNRERPDEVNFWQPHGEATYSALLPGAIFLFKLKRPFNHIAGGACLVKSSALPLPLAWDAFGSKTNEASNGLLLRSDFHKLFDAGLVTVTPTHYIEVSSRIREEWFNGKAYDRLQGQKLASVPENPADLPNAAMLQWHNQNRFRA